MALCLRFSTRACQPPAPPLPVSLLPHLCLPACRRCPLQPTAGGASGRSSQANAAQDAVVNALLGGCNGVCHADVTLTSRCPRRRRRCPTRCPTPPSQVIERDILLLQKGDESSSESDKSANSPQLLSTAAGALPDAGGRGAAGSGAPAAGDAAHKGVARRKRSSFKRLFTGSRSSGAGRKKWSRALSLPLGRRSRGSAS